MDQPRTLATARDQAIQEPVEVPFGTAAALHRQARRFVQGDDVGALADDKLADEGTIGPAEHARSRFHPGRRLTHRRHTDRLPGRETHAGLGPGAVDAHLPRSEQLLQAAMRHGRIVHAEPAVEPHAALGRVHLFDLDPTHCSTVRAKLRPANSARMEKVTEALR